MFIPLQIHSIFTLFYINVKHFHRQYYAQDFHVCKHDPGTFERENNTLKRNLQGKVCICFGIHAIASYLI